MLEIIQSNIGEILVTILTAVFSYIGLKLKNIIEQCLNDKTKKAIVLDTIKYVEQVFVDLKGEEKFYKTKEKALEWLKERGINISDTELEILIESAINELNKIKRG